MPSNSVMKYERKKFSVNKTVILIEFEHKNAIAKVFTLLKYKRGHIGDAHAYL
jgi:hypothetical protein